MGNNNVRSARGSQGSTAVSTRRYFSERNEEAITQRIGLRLRVEHVWRRLDVSYPRANRASRSRETGQYAVYVKEEDRLTGILRGEEIEPASFLYSRIGWRKKVSRWSPHDLKQEHT